MHIILNLEDIKKLITDKFGEPTMVQLILTESDNRLAGKYKYREGMEGQENRLLELPPTLTFDTSLDRNIGMIVTVFDPEVEPKLEKLES